jgi:hypothetical protein
MVHQRPHVQHWDLFCQWHLHTSRQKVYVEPQELLLSGEGICSSAARGVTSHVNCNWGVTNHANCYFMQSCGGRLRGKRRLGDQT